MAKVKIVFYVDAPLATTLKQKSADTGAPVAALVRRAVLAMFPVQDRTDHTH